MWKRSPFVRQETTPRVLPYSKATPSRDPPAVTQNALQCEFERPSIVRLRTPCFESASGGFCVPPSEPNQSRGSDPPAPLFEKTAATDIGRESLPPSAKLSSRERN